MRVLVARCRRGAAQLISEMTILLNFGTVFWAPLQTIEARSIDRETREVS